MRTLQIKYLNAVFYLQVLIVHTPFQEIKVQKTCLKYNGNPKIKSINTNM